MIHLSMMVESKESPGAVYQYNLPLSSWVQILSKAVFMILRDHQPTGDLCNSLYDGLLEAIHKDSDYYKWSQRKVKND